MSATLQDVARMAGVPMHPLFPEFSAEKHLSVRKPGIEFLQRSVNWTITPTPTPEVWLAAIPACWRWFWI